MKKNIILGVLCVANWAYALSPRLLIHVDPTDALSVYDLKKEMDMHIVAGKGDAALALKINNLDITSTHHRIGIDGVVQDLAQLANEVGYEYLMIKDSDLSSACNQIKEKEKNIPLTDTALTRMDALKAGQIYALMMKVDRILKEHHISYWASFGTLLGAVRNRGLIPWDDDLDICVFNHDMVRLLELKELFKEQGLAIVLHPKGIYKIFFVDVEKIKISEKYKKDFNYQEYYEWTFPCLDIFPVRAEDDGMIRHAGQIALSIWPQMYFFPQEIVSPLPQKQFGPLYLPTPHNTHEILVRLYGADWNDIAYCMYDHQRENYVQKIKVALIDRSPIPYVLPVRD